MVDNLQSVLMWQRGTKQRRNTLDEKQHETTWRKHEPVFGPKEAKIMERSDLETGRPEAAFGILVNKPQRRGRTREDARLETRWRSEEW